MKEKGFFCIFSEDTAHLQLEEVYFLKKKRSNFQPVSFNMLQNKQKSAWCSEACHNKIYKKRYK